MNRSIVRMFFIAAFVIVGVTVAAAQRPILGGYKPTSVSGEEVVAAANFAVDKQSETTEGLTLDEVLKAESQVVQGMNFRLCLRVKLDDETQDVEVIVFQSLQGEFTLRSWTPKECGGD
jgi:flavin-binding protein dodecin